MKARIAGIGAYAPERVVTNDQLSEIVDTSDEWIRSRTGISERRISTGAVSYTHLDVYKRQTPCSSSPTPR